MADGFITPEEYQRRLAVQRASALPAPELPPVQQQDLSFSYGPTTENPPIRARSLYEQKLAQEPKLSEYHPTGLRKFLSILGGIGAGIGSHNLGTGLEVGKEIKYGPFLSKERAFQQELGNLKAKATSEETGETEQATLAGTKAKTAAEQATAGQEGATQELRRAQTRRLQPGTEEFKGAEEMQTYVQTKTLLGKLLDITLSDGTKIPGARATVNPSTRAIEYIGPNGTRYSDNVVSAAEEARERIPTTPTQLFQQENPSADAKAVAAFDAGYKRLVAESTGQRQKNIAQAGLATAETAEHGGLNPGDLAKVQQMISERPDQAVNIIKSLTKPQQLSLIRSGADIPLLNPDSQKRVRNASITLQHVDSIRRYLQDPDIQKELGAWVGRSEILKSKIGIDTGDPKIANLSPKTQEFISFLTYNRLWEATSTVGYRPSQRVIDMMGYSAPRISESLGRIEGALKAEEASTNNVISGELGKISGGKPETQTTPSSGSRKISNIKEVQ